MPRPIEVMGLGPKYVETKVPEGWKVEVTPPDWVGLPGSYIMLTENQYQRYRAWRDTGVLIQEALPELSPSQREVLMTGLGDEEFHEAAGPQPCPDCGGTGGLYASEGGVVTIDQPCQTCGGAGEI